MQNSQIEELFQELKQAITPLFDAAVVAHDMSHLERVQKTADMICVAESGERMIVAAAAWLHDYHRYQEKRMTRHISPRQCESEVRNLLTHVPSLTAGSHDAVCAAINFTEYYRCAGDDLDAINASLEARIVRDADMLDALGAVGIARAFMFGAYLGQPIWVADNLDPDHSRPFVHGKTTSVVHHFHEKLLRLEDEMLTEHGRLLARQRTAYMREFLATLMTEIA